MSETINFDDFTKVDLRVGTITEVSDFTEARNPSYKLKIDFGDLGVKIICSNYFIIQKGRPDRPSNCCRC